MKHSTQSLQKSTKRFDLNRSKRRATAKLISRIAFILFIAGIFFGFKVFNVSLLVVAIILWVLNSTIAGMLYPRRYAVNPPAFPQQQEYCNACGSALMAGATFCTECGAMVGNHPPST